MTETERTAYIVRVRRLDEDTPSCDLIQFYAVLTSGSADDAQEAVLQVVGPNVEVSYTGGKLSLETVWALGLSSENPQAL